jgi:subtilisin family serine protease
MSPRDVNGHGTHAASTIAGAPVRNASHPGGLAAGVARGGAPRVRLAVYKACWSNLRDAGTTCSSAAVLKAMDDAVHDGVDVLSLSLSLSLAGTVVEIPGSLHLVARGITVVFSAGNNGPVPGTALNASPWVITVAASTIDRSFPTEITLGNGEKLVVRSTHAIILALFSFIHFYHAALIWIDAGAILLPQRTASSEQQRLPFTC